MRVRVPAVSLLAGFSLTLTGCSGGSSATDIGSGPTAPVSASPGERLQPDASPAGPQRGRAAPGTSTNWPTYHGNRARTGVSRTMPAVSGVPRVTASLQLDGEVYASPIVARGITIVATENDSVYALNASNHRLWRRHLGSPSPASQRPCGNIDPLGITGTPVFDRVTGLVYVAAELSGTRPTHRLYALRLRNGTVAWSRTLDLPGVDRTVMQERGALTFAGGRVWVPFGGLAGDCGNYKGRVIGYGVHGRGAPVAFTVPTTREAGIWAPPGPSLGPDGNLYVAVGNGASVVGDPYDFSDSILKINDRAKRVGFFAPTTWATDNAADLDLGSQGPALVGKWVFSDGKSGFGYVLRRAQLGGIGGAVSRKRICVSFGGTAVVGNVVYVPCTDGVRAVGIGPRGRLHVHWHAASSITGAPVVGGGRVWALDPEAGVLHALSPRTGASRARVSVGPVSRFATPALSGRRVLIGTLSGLTVVTTS